MNDTKQVQDELRRSITVGWINALQLVVIMFLVSVVRAAIANDFKPFGRDPGNLGLDIMIVIFAIYALIPVAVRMFDGLIFRWTMVGAAVFFFLMFIAHQLTHMVVDKMPLNIYHVLDFSHHAVLLWLIVCSVRWARMADRPMSVAAAPELAVSPK
ncbi:hypothetical protein [Piscinibacter terrae]|uniref:Uncharacterized protein n=1 Tax=Piscinibacter terrae TaxID=2496871 RepID=A0A3N7JUQ5_9BURK|nr:hypothetical protein [Albitalea terrae]RQP22645.1 hypothetical protein DZC73_20265 [Albitalea terrae]